MNPLNQLTKTTLTLESRETEYSLEQDKQSHRFSRLDVTTHDSSNRYFARTLSDTDFHCRTAPDTTPLLTKNITPSTPVLPPGFPSNHTFQPYYWVSQRANTTLKAACKNMYTGFDFEGSTAKLLEQQCLKQLAMSEQHAKECFARSFEYRSVDYGFTCSGQENNSFGLFVKSPVNKGELLGIYSGVAYALYGNRSLNLGDIKDSETAWLTFEMSDFMSYYRTILRGLEGKNQEHRTPLKFQTKLEDPLSPDGMTVYTVPDSERFTPMHFINSANKREDINAVRFLAPVTVDGEIYCLSVYIALRDINAGEELLSDYMIDSAPSERECHTATAADEEAQVRGRMASVFECVSRVNKRLDIPVSKYAMAPVIYVSEKVRT